MTSSWLASNSLDVLSVAIGIFGLFYGFYQQYRRLRVEQLVQGNIRTALNRAKALVPYEKDIEDLIKDVQDPQLVKWVWTTYKGSVDLYVMLTNNLLSSERKFTYLDLEREVRHGVISSHWEEEVWRNIISRRRENVERDPPDFFLAPGKREGQIVAEEEAQGT